MFEKPLVKDDVFKSYYRKHYWGIFDDRESRVVRDIIHEFDGNTLRNEWIEIYPWEVFKAFDCWPVPAYAKTKGKWFIDSKTFDVNKPRNADYHGLISHLCKSPACKANYERALKDLRQELLGVGGKVEEKP